MGNEERLNIAHQEWRRQEKARVVRSLSEMITHVSEGAVATLVVTAPISHSEGKVSMESFTFSPVGRFMRDLDPLAQKSILEAHFGMVVRAAEGHRDAALKRVDDIAKQTEELRAEEAAQKVEALQERLGKKPEEPS